VNDFRPGFTADGAGGSSPSKKSGCETAPEWAICAKIAPPSECTAEVTARQPSILAFRKEAGDVDDSDRARADPSAFGEDEAGRRPLAIVFDMKLGGREFGIARAAARHGGHHHTVSELKSAKRVGREERRSNGTQVTTAGVGRESERSARVFNLQPRVKVAHSADAGHGRRPLMAKRGDYIVSKLFGARTERPTNPSLLTAFDWSLITRLVRRSGSRHPGRWLISTPRRQWPER
jgi:hypothetical protein